MSDDHIKTKRRSEWSRRLGWMILFWMAGVAVLALVAYLFRLLMGWAGFTS